MSLNGDNILVISLSTSSAFFVVGIEIIDRSEALSTAVVIAPFLLVPIIVSISKSPNLVLSSTIFGLCDIDTLSFILPLCLAPYCALLLPV